MIRRFNRYELKYVIHATKYRALVRDLKNFMVPDKHGDEDGFYRVLSLYYDSPGYDCYRSKIEGLKFRRKLRLRIYPGDDIRKVKTGFAEIKQRTNRTVQKKRLILPLEQAEALCTGNFDPFDLDEVDLVAASEILYMVRAMNLMPTAITSYRRQAFMGSRFEPGMRITFDMQLQGRSHSLKVNEVTRNHYFMPPAWFVMEVKVNDRIPTWTTTLLAKHECILQRVSKYCAVVANEKNRIGFAWKNRDYMNYG